jgi:multiple sugar transport system permease protein
MKRVDIHLAAAGNDGAAQRRRVATARGPRPRRVWTAQTRAAAGFLAPSVVGLLTFTTLPIAASLVLAFYRWPIFGPRSFVGLANFHRMFTVDPVFFEVLRNTVIFVVLYVPANVCLSLGLAAWLGPRIRGRHVIRVLIFIPVVTPVIANAVIWRLMFSQDGLVNSTLAVVGIGGPNWLGTSGWSMATVVIMSLWQGLGYNVLVFSAALEGVPQSLIEASMIDGAGAVRRFFRITVPLISPAIFFAIVMTMITSFQVFIQPYILTGGGPEASSTTLVLYLYRTGFQGSYALGYAASLAWVLFAIILTLTVAQFVGQRRWVHYEV